MGASGEGYCPILRVYARRALLAAVTSAIFYERIIASCQSLDTLDRINTFIDETCPMR